MLPRSGLRDPQGLERLGSNINPVLFSSYTNFFGKAAGSSSGRTHASGACYLGSNPSPAALPEIFSKNKYEKFRLYPRMRR